MKTDKKIYKDLSPLNIRYKYDNNIIFENNYIETDIGYNIITNYIFQNVRDQKINNYSVFYLTNKILFSDVLDIDKINNKKFNIISYLIINNQYITINNQSVYLNDTPVNKFEICFTADANKCFLKTFSDTLFKNIYITVKNQTLTPTTNIDEKTEFSYIINDSNELFLIYKSPINQISYVVTCVNNELTLEKNDISKYFTENQKIFISTKKFKDVNINTGWCTYSEKNFDINGLKTYPDLTNNLLVHSIYTYSDGDNLDINFLNLKNQITTKNYINNGDPFRGIDYREYTNLFTGTNQETGNNMISMNYNYVATDLKIKQGLNEFTTPSLYPYEKININDTSFVKNGSFGSGCPALADRIYKIDNNDLLQSYSWLSCIGPDDKGIWINRYYNPMLFNYQNVSVKPADIVYKGTSFDDIVKEHPEVLSKGYFDVVSDLALEPSTTYVYDRITNDNIVKFVDDNPFLVINGLTLLDSEGTIVSNNDTDNNIYVFNGDRYASVDLKTNVKYNQFCMSFYICSGDWNNVIANQIMGNYNCNGFAFKKNTTITPMPMLTFAAGVFFGSNDIWDKINKTSFGEYSKWDKYDLTWNQYASDSTSAVRGQYLFNTNFEVIDILPYIDTLIKTIRIDHLDYYYNIFKTQLIKMTPIGVETISVPLPLNDGEEIIGVSNDENNIYCLSNQKRIIEYNFNTDNITVVNISDNIEIGDELYNGCLKINDCYYITNTDRGILDYHPNLGIFYKHKQKYLADTTSGEDKEYDCILRYDPTINTSFVNDMRINYTTFFRADTIQDFKIINDDIGVIYNDSKFSLYDFDRVLKFTYDFKDINKKLIYFDYVSEITPEGYDSYYIIVAYDMVFDKYGNEITDTTSEDFTNEDYISIYKLKNNELTLIKNTTYSKTLLGEIQDTHLTQYSNIKKRNDERSDYYIQYKLLNKYNNQYDNRILDLPPFNEGTNHIVINFDGINGKLDIYINNKLAVSDNFESGKYIYENIFEDIFIVGNLSYFSSPLFKILKQPNYFCNNVTITDFKIFNNILDENFIKALNLYNTTIDDLVLTIPCNNRNKIENIERLFKQSVPGFTTNKLDLNIKNLIISEDDQIKLTKAIKILLKNKILASVDINDIHYKFTI